MRIHILGICGTFMAGIACLAKQLGHEVSGCDESVYPPMSTQLQEQGIKLVQGFAAQQLDPEPDIVIVGNAMTRGKAVVEAMLDRGIPYTSGPQWLAEHVLQGRWVLAVAGTHGKTTTSSMLAWVLDRAKLTPGFLIGGIPENFHVSARLGDAPFFVIEADEYDSAFFDKRSKFIHYRPRTLILNNLEYDHADIFPDLAAIQRQFHHLIRTVPNNGLVVAPQADKAIATVLEQGCWTPIEYIGDDDTHWRVELNEQDGSHFTVFCEEKNMGEVCWQLLGMHNVYNALVTIAAARHAGVPVNVSIEALTSFKNVKRRLELIGNVAGIRVYDDFAHHPTAVASTLAGLRAHVGNERIIAVLEFGSYSMRNDVHGDAFAPALARADEVILAQLKSSEHAPDLQAMVAKFSQPTQVCHDVNQLVTNLAKQVQPGDHILIMSNTGFGGVHAKLLDALTSIHQQEMAQ